MNTHEQRLLNSLKNRPGLEPDAEFLTTMRAVLFEKKNRRKWNSGAIFAAFTACGIAVVIILSLLTAKPEKMEQRRAETPSNTIDEKEVDQPPLKELPEVTFELTQEEKAAYETFKIEYDDSNLIKLSPVSVAKLYVQATLDEDYETQYELFTTRPEAIRWTKEEHLNFPAEDHGSREELLRDLGGLSIGKFIRENDDMGYIEFHNSNGKQGFKMIKDTNGVWKVSFMPIQ